MNGYSTIIGCRVQTYDYGNPKWWYKLESLRDRIKWRNQKEITEMAREELDELNQRFMHPPMPTLNFVTNIAGAIIVSEAVKLLTETGKVCHLPKVIDLDLYKNRMRIRNLYSPFRLETIKKVFGKWKDPDRFESFIEESMKKVGGL